MSEDTQVVVQSDKGTKNQWGKGLFYRQDGRKVTLVPKNFVGASAILFLILSTWLMVQGVPESSPDAAKGSEISTPGAGQEQTLNNIPPVDMAGPGPNGAGGHNGTGAQAHPRSRFTGPQLIRRPRSGKIPPGAFLKATLLSGASNGPVRAQVTESLTSGGETVVEEGAILLGSGQSGEDRLAIRFSQMIHADGAVDTIDGQACDAGDKIAGLKGSQVGSHGLKLATGIGLSFVGGMTTALQDTQGQSGAVITRPSLKNAMLGGAATATLEQSRDVMTDLKNKPAPIEVPAGAEIYVLLQGNG